MAKSDFLHIVAQMPANKWTESLFTLLDFEENSEMSFSDFLLVLSTYCMFDANAIVKLVFFSFDRDKNGKIDMEELMELLVAIHGKHLEENVVLAVEAIDKAEIDITYRELRRINKVYPAVLYPAFRMQVNMRHYAMGVKWWETKMQAVVDYNKGLVDLKNSNSNTAEKELRGSSSPGGKFKNRMRLLSKKSSSFSDSKGDGTSEGEEEEDLEMSRAGLMYFCCPSRRVQVVAQAQKLKQLEQQLDERLDNMIENQLEAEAAAAAAATAASVTPAAFA